MLVLYDQFELDGLTKPEGTWLDQKIVRLVYLRETWEEMRDLVRARDDSWKAMPVDRMRSPALKAAIAGARVSGAELQGAIAASKRNNKKSDPWQNWNSTLPQKLTETELNEIKDLVKHITDFEKDKATINDTLQRWGETFKDPQYNHYIPSQRIADYFGNHILGMTRKDIVSWLFGTGGMLAQLCHLETHQCQMALMGGLDDIGLGHEGQPLNRVSKRFCADTARESPAWFQEIVSAALTRVCDFPGNLFYGRGTTNKSEIDEPTTPGGYWRDPSRGWASEQVPAVRLGAAKLERIFPGLKDGNGYSFSSGLMDIRTKMQYERAIVAVRNIATKSGRLVPPIDKSEAAEASADAGDNHGRVIPLPERPAKPSEPAATSQDETLDDVLTLAQNTSHDCALILNAFAEFMLANSRTVSGPSNAMAVEPKSSSASGFAPSDTMAGESPEQPRKRKTDVTGAPDAKFQNTAQG